MVNNDEAWPPGGSLHRPSEEPSNFELGFSMAKDMHLKSAPKCKSKLIKMFPNWMVKFYFITAPVADD